MPKILVATDGSRGGSAAVRFAARLAGAMRSARVHAILVGTAMRDSIFGTSGVPFPNTALPEMVKEEKRRAEITLAAAAREFRKHGLRPQVRYIAPRDLAPVATAILREADRIDADLIVVGSAGHGGLSRWMLGSVANRLTRAASRPVAVIHPPRTRRGK
jgi:nucleotide-binding universal stress UspA family protein